MKRILSILLLLFIFGCSSQEAVNSDMAGMAYDIWKYVNQSSTTDFNVREQMDLMGVGEVGVIENVKHNFGKVQLLKAYQNPVVVAKPLSTFGGQAAHARVKWVGADSFLVRVEEWYDLDGGHVEEDIQYIILEEGTHNMFGLTMEAHSFVAVSKNWYYMNFSSYYPEPPVVLAQIQSLNGASPLTTRINNIANYGFSIKVQTEESIQYPDTYQPENVGFIAISPGEYITPEASLLIGKTPRAVKHKWYKINFGNEEDVFIADAQSTYGGDTADLRYRNFNDNSVEVKIHEEQSRDSETYHTTEIVGYLAASQTQHICGDSICSGQENCQSCPSDCLTGECCMNDTRSCVGSNGCDGMQICGNGSFGYCYPTQNFCDTNCDGSSECTNLPCPPCTCINGEQASCQDYVGCQGIMSCVNGLWGNCVSQQNYCDANCDGTPECTNQDCHNCTCMHADMRFCLEGNMNGTQTCVNGVWGACDVDYSGYGSLSVYPTPLNASVYVSQYYGTGFYSGYGPTNVTLPVGDYNMQVSAPGYMTYKKNIQISQGHTHHNIILYTGGYGTLQINSNPTGAQVKFDDSSYVYYTPYSRSKWGGFYGYCICKTGYMSQWHTAWVNVNDVTVDNVNLQPDTGFGNQPCQCSTSSGGGGGY